MKKHSGNTGRILDYLKENKGITSMEAFEKFGATRLSAIIHTLRGDGYVIENIKRTAPNRYGTSVTFVEYRLVGEIER